MSHYKISEGQKRYLRRMYAEQNELQSRACDCAGCDKCEGFVPGCTCDEISAADLKQYRTSRLI